MTSLAAGLLGSEPLVSLLGDGQTDSLPFGQGHPRLVALQMMGEMMFNVKSNCAIHTKRPVI